MPHKPDANAKQNKKSVGKDDTASSVSSSMRKMTLTEDSKFATGESTVTATTSLLRVPGISASEVGPDGQDRDAGRRCSDVSDLDLRDTQTDSRSLLGIPSNSWKGMKLPQGHAAPFNVYSARRQSEQSAPGEESHASDTESSHGHSPSQKAMHAMSGSQFNDVDLVSGIASHPMDPMDLGSDMHSEDEGKGKKREK